MKIPRKNISKKITDVRKPYEIRASEPIKTDTPTEKITKIILPERKVNPISTSDFSWKKVIGIILASVILGGLFFAFSVYEKKKELLNQVKEKISDTKLGSNNSINGIFNISNFQDISNRFIPILKSGLGTYQDLAGLASAFLKTSDDLNLLNQAISGNLSGDRSGKTLSALKELQADAKAMREIADNIDENSLEFRELFSFLPSDYVAFKYGLRYWENALSELNSWLMNSEKRKIAVFLQNSSEVRPTGGFWGSFLEINLKNGDIDSMEVRDISEVDRVLDTKTIPPKQLQLLIKNWRTADANWFFDFKDSASRAARFMDASNFYSSKNEHIDAVFAVSPKVISDILSQTGPITASSSKTAVDKDNFLPIIQEEVQKGHDVGSLTAKNILKDIFPVLLQKLSYLDQEKQKIIFSNVLNWFKDKDVVLWAEDPELESVFEAKNVAGRVFEIPKKFEGDYLAITAANIGGGKTDYVMTQNINFESQLNLDGTVSNKLAVSRRHNGKRSDPWWYKETNQVYLTAYISEPGTIEDAKGGIAKQIYAPINYSAAGYEKDELVSALEASRTPLKNLPWLTRGEESGKTTLSAWIRTPMNSTTTLVINYTHRLFLSPADGVGYQFVFDKQPGVNGDYDFSLIAPAGFTWADNNSPLYEYKSDNPPARVTISLTLKKSAF